MIVTNSDENIARGAEILKRGGLVSFPTETVYGLGGNSLDARAVAKIFEAKQRPSFDPLITHISSLEGLDRVAKIKDKSLYDKLEKIWPGPLTIIVPKRDIIPSLVCSGLSTMAVRMPNHPTALKLISQSTGAIAAPSANPFGFLSPTTATHVENGLGDRIDMVIDGGSCSVGVESTVLDLSCDKPRILRPGGLSVEYLQDFFGKIDIYDRTSLAPTAPGQLKMHYSPRKPLFIVDSIEKDIIPSHSIGVLSFQGGDFLKGFGSSEVLSQKGDIVEAASTLFAALHRLDNSSVETLFAERVPLDGIGRAVMDRIYKASEK